MACSCATFDGNISAPLKGVQGDSRRHDGITQDTPPQPDGCCPLEGEISKGDSVFSHMTAVKHS